MKLLEDYLLDHPKNSLAQAQLLRLRACSLAPQELQEDVETLMELGEEVSDDLLPDYIESLLETAQGGKARDIVLKRLPRLDARSAARIAWVCYHLQAYDLALQLFQCASPENRTNFKFIAAMETSADRCGRIDELIRLYNAYASDDKRLYGRIRRLKSRVR